LEVTPHREADALDRAIDLRITRLRRKVEIDPAHPETIRTVCGVGYMFVPPKKLTPSAEQRRRRPASLHCTTQLVYVAQRWRSAIQWGSAQHVHRSFAGMHPDHEVAPITDIPALDPNEEVRPPQAAIHYGR
jgi:hypothetical protein